MRDEYDARLWEANHEQLSQSIDDGIALVRHAFVRLTARLYDAPWDRAAKTRRGAC